MEKLKLNYEEILPEIKNNDEKDKLIQELAQTNLNKEQIREILREEVLNSKYSEKINDIFNEINNVKTHYGQIIEKIKEINDKENTIEETSRKNITSEQIKEILKEEISTIDYAEQINYMNEMITNLKDSYLELSNIVRTNNLEISQIDNNIDNIIDLKLLKKQKEQKEPKQKKKVFSIEDEISYDELEKTAVCIIPLKTKNDESYKKESIM